MFGRSRYTQIMDDRFWWIFAAYVLGIVLLVVVGMIPSEVETTYSWQGALLMLVLLGGLAFGVRVCRWALIALGVFSSLGTLLLASPSLDVVVIAWSALALVVTSLLLVPPMDRHANRVFLLGHRDRSN